MHRYFVLFVIVRKWTEVQCGREVGGGHFLSPLIKEFICHFSLSFFIVVMRLCFSKIEGCEMEGGIWTPSSARESAVLADGVGSAGAWLL